MRLYSCLRCGTHMENVCDVSVRKIQIRFLFAGSVLVSFRQKKTHGLEATIKFRRDSNNGPERM